MIKAKISGQSVLEILIAVAVVAVLLVSLLSLTTMTLKSSNYSRDLNIATKLSNEAADWLREFRSVNGFSQLKEMVTVDGTVTYTKYCINNLPNSKLEFELLQHQIDGCDYVNPLERVPGTIFWREMEFDKTNADDGRLQVTVTTYWQGKNDKFKAPIIMTVSDWK